MREQTANDPESWTSFFGPGIALRTRGFQLVVEDVSHWNVFLGVLATLIGVSSVGALLALILDHHVGLYLFALCVAALIPLVVLLMAKRKVIVDLLRKKIKRVTNRRLFWTESTVIRVLDVDRAEKKMSVGPTGRLMSKVVLIMYNEEQFDVTMFFDTMNDQFKDTIVNKINHYLHIAQKTSHDRNAEEEEGEEEHGSSDFEEETEEMAEGDTLPEGATLDDPEIVMGRSVDAEDEEEDPFAEKDKGKDRVVDEGEGEAKEDTLILI